MKKVIGVSLMCLSLSAFAQDQGIGKEDKTIEIKEKNINLDTRGDRLTGSNVSRLQDRVRIGFTIDAFGVVEIVGLATTGSAFNNDWATVLSNNGTQDPIELAFRNIYLRKTMGKVSVEAGALSPITTVGSGGLAPTGWIDGIRVNTKTQIGDFKVTAGSLGSFKQPDAFKRSFEANFIEIELDKKVFENIMTQTAVDVYNGDVFLREDLKIDLKVLGDKVFKIFADSLYDVHRNLMSYEIGTEFDVLKDLVNKYDNRVNLKLYYSNVNENIPLQSGQLTSFYTYGSRLSAQIGGKIDKQGNVNWFTRASFGQSNRYDVGLTIKIPTKKR